MEKEDYLQLSYFLTSVSVISIVSTLIYKWLRPKFPVAVNCWFCQRDHRVKYDEQNNWECPSCQQYNGFDQTGDYNRVITSQYEAAFNPSQHFCDVSEYKKSKNGLCSRCNRNQLLKVKQLAQFEPINEDCFDEEIELYQQHLDSVYKLCPACDFVVHKSLSEINRTLRKDVLNWRLGRKDYYLNTQKANSHKLTLRLFVVFILRLCSIVYAFAWLVDAFCSSGFLDFLPESYSFSSHLSSTCSFLRGFTHHPVSSPFTGFFIVIIAIFIAGKDKLQLMDAAVCFSWLLIVFTDIDCIHNALSSIKIHTYIQTLFTFLAFSTSFYAMIKHNQRNSSLNTSSKCKNTSVKKKYSSVENNSSSWERLKGGGEDEEWCQLQDSRISTTTTSTSPKFGTGESKEFSLNSDLSTMSIGTPKKFGNLPHVFTVKSYGTGGLPLKMQTSSSLPVRRNILSPPRLHSQLYSPWGSSANLNSNQPFIYGRFSCGYYKPFTSSSSCPVSRCGSVSGDDRLSLFSEPTALPYTSFMKPELGTFRRNSASPSQSVSSSCSSSDDSSFCEDNDVSTVKTSTPNNRQQGFQPKSLLKNNSTWMWLIWLVLGLSLLSNAGLLLHFLTNWRFSSFTYEW